MRSLQVNLSIVLILLSVWFKVPALASDELAPPTAPSIEKLLREWLADDDLDMPWLDSYKNADLLAFLLVDLHQVSSSRWHAETELLFDFGPPPPAIVGFEQIRLGRYRLMLNRQNQRMRLMRFSPVATVHLLPDGA